MAETRTCFVIGPIGGRGTDTRKSADFLLKGIIRPALESLNLQIWRADEDSKPGMITDKLISDIYESDLVVADLSELNANAFYELGIRHSASKPVIHMAAEGTKLPFDNLGYRAIVFDRFDWDNIETTRRELLSQATDALSSTHQVSNPVTQALSTKAFRASAEPSDKILAELMNRMIKVEQSTSIENTPEKPKKFRPSRESMNEAHDIFTDVAKMFDIAVVEPYFSQAMKEILEEFTIGYISNLYDKMAYEALRKIILDNYIPF